MTEVHFFPSSLGGEQVILRCAGQANKEPTQNFEDVFHSTSAVRMTSQYYITDLDPEGPG
jgi:hypothetical protein